MPEYEPFPGIVCAYIRNCVKAKRKATSEREQTFEARDEASRRIGEALVAQQATEEHEAAYGRAVMTLDILGQRLKYLEGEIDKAIENADEPNLPYKNAKVDIPDFKPRAKAHADKPGKAKEGDDIEGQTKIQPDAPLPTGESQQLAADPSELDLSGPVLAKLRKAGIVNIAQLAALYDDESRDARAELNLNENQASVLHKSLKDYRRRHRAAIAEAEKEGAAPRR